MKVSYFPGCTLRNKAKDLDRWARASMAALGVELVEPDEWQCCGGVFTTSRDEIATKLSSIRLLAEAHDAGRPLVTVCSACHNVIKQTNRMMQTDDEFIQKVNRYLAQDTHPLEYYGGTVVYHLLELIRDVIGFDKLKAAVKKPLTGRKIAPYYGCLLLRPTGVMQFDDPENPTTIENFLKALGAEPVISSTRNECCGGYVALDSPATAKKRSKTIVSDAASHGAEAIVTACPLCRYNLMKSGSEIPVIYFTELLAEALGVKEDAPDGQ